MCALFRFENLLSKLSVTTVNITTHFAVNNIIPTKYSTPFPNLYGIFLVWSILAAVSGTGTGEDIPEVQAFEI